MNALIRLHNSAFDRIGHFGPVAIPTLARFLFAAVLFTYYWNSATTKVGNGLFSPSIGAYYQIFPKLMDSISGDISKLGSFHWLVVEAGLLAEFALPVLIVLGLFTRLAAIGMIGFMLVQSLTDIFGHGLDAGSIGRWFDRDASSLLMDQRALWVFLLVVLIFKGAGPLSIDRLLSRRSEM